MFPEVGTWTTWSSPEGVRWPMKAFLCGEWWGREPREAVQPVVRCSFLSKSPCVFLNPSSRVMVSATGSGVGRPFYLLIKDCRVTVMCKVWSQVLEIKSEQNGPEPCLCGTGILLGETAEGWIGNEYTCRASKGSVGKISQTKRVGKGQNEGLRG